MLESLQYGENKLKYAEEKLEHDLKIQKEDREAKKNYKTEEIWYRVRGIKLVEVKKKVNGNLCSRFVGHVNDPKVKEFMEQNKRLIKS